MKLSLGWRGRHDDKMMKYLEPNDNTNTTCGSCEMNLKRYLVKKKKK